MYSLRGKIIILPLRHFFNKYKNMLIVYKVTIYNMGDILCIYILYINGSFYFTFIVL